MANYYYNEVELPDINEVWTDKVSYPYAAITRMFYADDTESIDATMLYLCNNPAEYRDTTKAPFFPSGSKLQAYQLSDGGFELVSSEERTGALTLLDGYDVYTLIWSSNDIFISYWNDDKGGYDHTSEVYFSASDPVPVSGELSWQNSDLYKMVNGSWVKHDGYKRVNGQWVKQDAYAMMEVPEQEDDPIVYPANCLTFSSAEAFTIGVYDATKHWDGTLYYSTDTETWSEWDGTTVIESAEHGLGQRIYMRGSSNSVIAGASIYYKWVLTGSSIRCDGNIENLLDHEIVANGGHPTMAKGCYQCMFLDCTSLITAPELPATTLEVNCYYSMFDGCTALTAAPELPATTLAGYCYGCMFRNCTSLTTAPELPSTTMTDHCYSEMFKNCTSLKTPPKLPATICLPGCYYGMFTGCSSLLNAPKLPATTLDSSCYQNMFSNCTSVVHPPELPAEKMFRSCYESMFENCTSLKNAPELPNSSATKSFYAMFRGCTSLETLPKLKSTVITDQLKYIFYGCTSIKISKTKTDEYQNEYRIPYEGTGTQIDNTAFNGVFTNTGGTFTGTPTINTTYYTSNTVI